MPRQKQILFHCETLGVISSGHIFTVTTANPVTHPLPSEELLTMQWNLTRIAIMQGAGEDEDSDIDSGGDSVAVTSGSRSPIKEARMFPERLVPISPRGSPSKGTSSLTENVLTENVPCAHRPIMPPGLPMPPSWVAPSARSPRSPCGTSCGSLGSAKLEGEEDILEGNVRRRRGTRPRG